MHSFVSVEQVKFKSNFHLSDEPDNMTTFWKFLLRKSLPSDSLTKLNFGVIGLGDSSYQKFNFVAKRLHKRLIQLGATPIQPAGLCDDQHDIGAGAILFPWLENLWKKVLELMPLPVGLNPLEKTPRTTRWVARRCQTLVAVDETQDIYLPDFEETPTDGYVEVVVRKFSRWILKDFKAQILGKRENNVDGSLPGRATDLVLSLQPGVECRRCRLHPPEEFRAEREETLRDLRRAPAEHPPERVRRADSNRRR